MNKQVCIRMYVLVFFLCWALNHDGKMWTWAFFYTIFWSKWDLFYGFLVGRFTLNWPHHVARAITRRCYFSSKKPSIFTDCRRRTIFLMHFPFNLPCPFAFNLLLPCSERVYLISVVTHDLSVARGFWSILVRMDYLLCFLPKMRFIFHQNC